MLKPFKQPLSTLLIALSVFCSSVSFAQDIHEPWQALLSKHVKSINNDHSTAVDYAGFKKEEVTLNHYLTSLSNINQATFDQWSNAKQLAFLINAYNAWTVSFILTEYPELESIKDLGSLFSSPWSKEFVSLLGKKRSLDEVEHELIRGSGNYPDPRIHFAVNCASIGCPALRGEAYTESKLEQQLQQQTIRFLSDESRNKLTTKELQISSIFKWYGGDFEKGFRGTNSLTSFILLYSGALNLTETQQKLLKMNQVDIDFLDYNWDLNAAR
nr:DUF547 domain-containing protein [Colwellia sp. 20A7]